MINFIGTSHDPHFNLAMEEYFIKHFATEDDCIILWQNSPVVVIGKNQNTLAEVNYEYCKTHNIQVVRRLSGGGAVYHDLGNLNFTYITANNHDGIGPNFKKFTQPVINALAQLGVVAELSGRNDITIDGKKFSGNAQYYYKDRVLHHGTILYSSDLSMVQNALNVKQSKIEAKGVKSVRSRVTNVLDYLTTKATINEFMQTLMDSLMIEAGADNKPYVLTPENLIAIKKIQTQRYDTWEWNFGRSPKFNLKQEKRFEQGTVEFYFDVDNGLINACNIFGDFFGKQEISELEAKMAGLEFSEAAVTEFFKTINVHDYFGKLTSTELLTCIFQ
ncbi:MAG: lipoate--protein ligase [Clostridia bacterium]